jgi:hypothetical protein
MIHGDFANRCAIIPRDPSAKMLTLSLIFNGHIGKPIERAVLYNNIQRWLPRVAGDEIDIEPGQRPPPIRPPFTRARVDSQ